MAGGLVDRRPYLLHLTWIRFFFVDFFMCAADLEVLADLGSLSLRLKVIKCFRICKIQFHLNKCSQALSTKNGMTEIIIEMHAMED